MAPVGHQLGKGPEGVLDVLQVLEEVQMVGVHIQDHGHCGQEGQEGVAVFAGLQNDGVPLPHPVAAAQDGKGAADHHRGVTPCGQENMGTHGGGGGFAVGAGNTQSVGIVAHQCAPGLGALKDGDPGGVGSGDLRVVVVDGSGADDAVRSLHALGQVTNGHRDAQGAEVEHAGALVQVGAGNDDSLAQQHFSQGGHRYAADPHQVGPQAGTDIIFYGQVHKNTSFILTDREYICLVYADIAIPQQ